MSRTDPIAVFAYEFAHKKTQDFLLELAGAGFRDVTVFGAPWKALSQADAGHYFPTAIRHAPALGTPQVCEALAFDFYRVEHNDFNAISALRSKRGFALGVISGARIIKRSVIDIFSEGILNLHPGKLPETAGLDSFFYTVERGVPLGVTAHYIDGRVDAGEELFFEETSVGPDDGVEAVLLNNYQTQILALRRFLAERASGLLQRKPVARPAKNSPMSTEGKRATIEVFPAWRNSRHREQVGQSLLTACKVGHISMVEEFLSVIPGMIEFRSPEGWTPLIVAAYSQQRPVVEFLLSRGADPNACGRKGTTVLMYAKTALIGKTTPDFRVLGALLEAGADPRRCDAAGKDIFYYLDRAGDTEVASWLSGKGVAR